MHIYIYIYILHTYIYIYLLGYHFRSATSYLDKVLNLNYWQYLYLYTLTNHLSTSICNI